jgi:predicted Zn-dependent protease
MSTGVVELVLLTWTLSLPPSFATNGSVASAQQASPDYHVDPSDLESQKKTALQEAEAGDTNSAIRDYQLILHKQPNWQEGQWNLGMLEYQTGRFKDSTAAFQKVVKYAPNEGIAWAILGLSEFEIRAYAESLSHLEKAQQLGTKADAEIDRVANYHLALLLIRNSKFDRGNDLLLKNFGGDLMSPQVKTALGLATLRVPLLPDEVDPSQEALIAAVGTVASSGSQAVEQYPALLRSYPDVPYLHYAYGLALSKLGRDQEAADAMHRETTISPNSPLPWLELSRIDQRIGNAEDARPSAQKAAKLAEQLNPAAPEQRIVLRYGNTATATSSTPDPALCNKAMQQYGSSQYAAAIPDLKSCLRQNPNNGTGWAVLGLSEYALQDYDNALIHLDRGKSLGLSGSPESLRFAQYISGILLIRSGEYDLGAESLIAASKSTLTDHVTADQVDYALGLALLRRPELPGRASPQQAEVILAAGKIRRLLRNSEYDEAFVRFKALLRQNPNFPFLHYAYGTALLAMSEFDEAAVQMKLETTISPSSELPWVRVASIALRKHDPTEASVAAKRAVELAPNSAEAHYLLGRALLEDGDNTAALPELLAAGRISPSSPEVHFNLAKAYARAQMPEQAERERIIFSQLNEAAEQQRRQQGNGAYQGPHNAGDISAGSQSAPTATAAPK